MTERPVWDAGPGEHPDEGTIHAWLDDALDAASAERVAAHVRGCAACSAVVAEARGLIAGASRVVASLDDVPAGTRPVWAQEGTGQQATGGGSISAAGAEERSAWRRLRVTPARAAIAATILVALGITLTHNRVAVESDRTVAIGPRARLDSAPATGAPAPGAGSPEIAGAPAAGGRRSDGLLDSAIAHNLAIAQGTRSIEAAPGPAIPQAPPPSAGLPATDAPATVAEQRVAAGRAAAQARRDTVAGLADRARVGRAATVTGDAGMAPAIASTARPTIAGQVAGNEAAGASLARGYGDVGARACFSIESTESGAMWGEQPLPLVLVVDSGAAVGTRGATIRVPGGGPTLRASWTRRANDSVLVTLQPLGATSAIALGPEGAGGRSGAATGGLPGVGGEQAVVAQRVDAGADARAKSAPAAAARREPERAARKSAAAPAAAPAAEASAPARSALRVVLRPIPCPIR